MNNSKVTKLVSSTFNFERFMGKPFARLIFNDVSEKRLFYVNEPRKTESHLHGRFL